VPDRRANGRIAAAMCQFAAVFTLAVHKFPTSITKIFRRR